MNFLFFACYNAGREWLFEMKIDPHTMKWKHRPVLALLDHEKVVIETDPFSDIHTGKTEAAELSFSLKGSFCYTQRIDFAFQHSQDQCGLLIYKGKERKAVCSVMSRNEDISYLQTIVYHEKGGDRSAREITGKIQWISFRIWHRSGMIYIQYSFNGKVFRDMREFKVDDDGEEIQIGLYACSPNQSSFDCTFSQMILERQEENTQ